MKYNPPAADLFISNRERFMRAMLPGTMAVFFSNDLIMDNADSHYPFRQNSNMYYLSGIDQEEVILMLFPEAPKPDFREILLVRKTNEHIQIWEGWKYSLEEAAAASGISKVFYIEEFENLFLSLINHSQGIYLDFNEHERNRIFTETAAHRLAKRLKKQFPAHSLHRSAPILEKLRTIKSSEEIELIKTACGITRKAFLRTLRFVRSGVWEHEIEAEILHEFIRNRATGPAYGSIIAAGKNACVLHYVQNNQQCQEGELILMDFGAEYANYSSDLTRTIPVSGKFSARQKDVYNSVLRIMKHATNQLVQGKTLDTYHTELGSIVTEELLKLGLLTLQDLSTPSPIPPYKKYFMHGCSHYLGLDTHDVGSRYTPFEPGMVFTCEPGIYIPEEGIGIRIENNIWIQGATNTDLMADIPREVDEIEAIMAGDLMLV